MADGTRGVGQLGRDYWVPVLRSDDAHGVTRLAEAGPSVVAGLRRFELFRGRIDEGSIRITVSLISDEAAWRPRFFDPAESGSTDMRLGTPNRTTSRPQLRHSVSSRGRVS